MASCTQDRERAIQPSTLVHFLPKLGRLRWDSRSMWDSRSCCAARTAEAWNPALAVSKAAWRALAIPTACGSRLAACHAESRYVATPSLSVCDVGALARISCHVIDDMSDFRDISGSQADKVVARSFRSSMGDLTAAARCVQKPIAAL